MDALNRTPARRPKVYQGTDQFERLGFPFVFFSVSERGDIGVIGFLADGGCLRVEKFVLVLIIVRRTRGALHQKTL